MIESSLVYRKGVSPRGVPDALTLRKSQNLAFRFCVCSRSGAKWGFTPHERQQVFAMAKTCIKMIESSLVYRKGVSPRGVPDALTLRKSQNLAFRFCVCSRSGAKWGFTPHERQQVFAMAKTCIRINRKEEVGSFSIMRQEGDTKPLPKGRARINPRSTCLLLLHKVV